ncbi:MAG: nitronate monooxygenase, partial [Parvularculaceae bacterium]|nr:nitronate monooxygenase [Parvularculaceae bacterium]
PESDPSKMNFGSCGNTEKKAWENIWGCGQGIGAIKRRGPAGDYVARLAAEYEAAKKRICR